MASLQLYDSHEVHRTKGIPISFWLMGFVALGVAAGVYWSWTITPDYALRQIIQAVTTHDLAKFHKFVDSESVVSRAVDDLMVFVIEQNRSSNKAESLGVSLGFGLIQLMKPSLVENAKGSIARVIEGTTSRKSDADDGGQSVSFEDIRTQFTGDGKAFQGMKHIDVQGKVAVVGLAFRIEEFQEELVLELKLRKSGYHWQLAEISNLPSLLKHLQELREAQLERINGPVRSRMAQTLEVIGWTRERQTDRWEISKSVLLHVTVRSASTKVVKSYVAFVRVVDANGTPAHEMSIRAEDSLAPGESKMGTWKVNVSPFDSSTERLYGLEVDAQLVFDPQRIEFQDGEILELITKIESSSGPKPLQ